MSSLRRPDRPVEYHVDRVASQMPATEPSKDYLAVRARERASNRIFKFYDDIVNQSCDAWNNFVDQPWKIVSIGLRDWADRS
jgi:hypothetical protein